MFYFSDPTKHHRRSIRLREYDYSQSGAYFVTICTHNLECLFGEIVNGEMRVNENGRLVIEEWLKTADVRNNIELDEYVVMPNHFHGIIVLTDLGATRRVAPTDRTPKLIAGSIGAIIGQFKSIVTKRINKIQHTSGIVIWQRNYYEHIIRNEEALNRIREYIQTNPLRWEMDQENPNRQEEDDFDRWLRSLGQPAGFRATQRFRATHRVAPTK